MSLTIPIALFGWVPFTLLLFALLHPRQALIWAILGGWMFLPIAGYKIEGIPDIDKVSVCLLSALLGAVLFDGNRFLACRPRWFDLIVLIWTLAPGVSAADNGFGLRGAINGIQVQAITWTVPYLLGRVYFRTAADLRALAVAIFVSGLIYVPLCLLEIRLSPQLHRWIYGYHQHAFVQTLRFGGYRPMVFMQHGLAVGMWMTNACIAGFWLWWVGGIRSTWGWPTSLLLGILLTTTILCKSTGALALLAVGLIALLAIRTARTRAFVLLLLITGPLYAATRTTGLWSGQGLVELAEAVSSKERAESLAGRLWNEDLLANRAMERPLFGWSGWDRTAVYDAQGRRVTTQDGMWIIVLGAFGLTGLFSYFLILLLPAALLLIRRSSRCWRQAELSGAVVLSTVLVLTTIDCIFNAMYSPIWMLASAALFSVRDRAVRRPLVQARVLSPSKRVSTPLKLRSSHVPSSI